MEIADEFDRVVTYFVRHTKELGGEGSPCDGGLAYLLWPFEEFERLLGELVHSWFEVCFDLLARPRRALTCCVGREIK